MTEASITILRIGDLIKLHLESKDKHGGYKNVYSGALDDWSDFSFITILDAIILCLEYCTLEIMSCQKKKKV